MNTMFETLLQLPLFQGMCHEDFTIILDKAKFHFAKHKAGKCIVNAGDPCDRLCFLLNGELNMTTCSDGGILSVVERISGPYVAEPHSLFGMEPSFAASYSAYTEANTVAVDKASITTLLFYYEVFRFNYINMIVNRTQHLYTRLWEKPVGEIRKKIARFFLMHCEKSAGEKIFKIKMNDLALYLDTTRLNTSR
ncbi:MAG: Crp/Fnr family transcriptional regulator, partial [Mediterranea sp.]|nr:Crp/Fnr family transcriptional regulator [Mediterranea sp.]